MALPQQKDSGFSLDTSRRYRLITRSDFDGLVCAVLLKHLDVLDDISGCYVAFDHHLSETIRNGAHDNHIIDPDAPSAARVVYDYLGGTSAFPADWTDMMEAVDKADSAQYEEFEILEPTDWTFLNYLMDARTGLGRFREFTISNYDLMMKLIDACTKHSIEEILQLPDVVERTELYISYKEQAEEQLKRCSTVHDNVVVLDLREEETIYPTNRFMIYALFPECNMSIHQMWGLKKQNIVYAMGKSIIKRDSNTNVGEVALRYGGGGHMAAGTCQVSLDRADAVLDELIKKLNADG